MGLFGKDKTSEGSQEVVDLNAETIDLTVPPKQVWGGPSRCPECTGRGYLDRIDVRDRVMYQHCLECGHNWSVSESELASQA